ncbi:glutamine synthetase [Chloroflexota bacterium]
MNNQYRRLVSARELEAILADGTGFDGSSIKGFTRIDKSGMIALPDPATFQILPWSLPQYPVARMFCDILKPEGETLDSGPS